MPKLAIKIALPIVLVGTFVIVVFLAVNYQQLGSTVYLIILLLIVYVFSFGLAVGQSVTSPIRKILERATELSNGNLSSRVYLETKDELAELALVFNKIAEELQEKHEQGENAEKSVGIKVKAKTEELEETINALQQKVKNRSIELEKLITESTKLKGEAENKEIEAVQLRKELDDFKKKITSKNARTARS
jgi:methyl-accepting chemotaxis protein